MNILSMRDTIDTRTYGDTKMKHDQLVLLCSLFSLSFADPLSPGIL